MANKKAAAPSLDAMLRADRQERGKKQEMEQLADKIFVQKRRMEQLADKMLVQRSRTPVGGRPQASLGASLASRVGVLKRPAALPRTSSAPPRTSRSAVLHSRPLAGAESARQQRKPAPAAAQPLYVSDTVGESVDDIDLDYADVAGSAGGEISIRGAAAGPYIVVAQNFAPGTTAADIESVMLNVGGEMTKCHLVCERPTVIAEMHFVDRAGAETVINTFNNKKADGRTLHVYWQISNSSNTNISKSNARPRKNNNNQTNAQPVPVDVEMEIDENTAAREEQDRIREERRPVGNANGGKAPAAPTGPRPTGPRAGYSNDNYYRESGRNNGGYQGGGGQQGNGYARGGGGGGGRYGGRGYPQDGQRNWR